MVSGTYVKTKGMRAVHDLIDAALAQGWTVKEAKNQHIQLYPPDGGVPVGIANTPSDTNQRWQVLRQLRKGGFIWPPTISSKAVKRMDTFALIVAAQDQGWDAQATHGRTRLMPPDPDKPMVMVPPDCCPRDHVLLVQHLRQSGFIWPPPAERELIKLRKRASDPAPVEPVEEVTHNQEELVVMSVEEKVQETPSGGVEEWVEITDKQWQEGWKVSNRGLLQRPNGTIISGNNKGNKAKHVIVGITRPSGMHTTTRMDKLVLNGFKGGGDQGLSVVHNDGDLSNCKLENLSWGEPTTKLTSVPKTDKKPFKKLDEWREEIKAQDGTVGAALVAEVTDEIAKAEAKKKDDVLAIDDLELTTATFNLLARNGIWNTGDIATWSPYGLSQLKSFTSDKVDEVAGKMAELGLTMQPNPEFPKPLEVDVTPEVVTEEIVPEAKVDVPVTELVFDTQDDTETLEMAQKVYEHQEWVEKVVSEAPSFSHPGLTVGEAEAKAMDEKMANATAEKPKKPRKSRAKPKPAPVAAAPRGGGVVFRNDLDKVVMTRSFSFNDVRIDVDENGDFDEFPATTDYKSLATVLLAIDRWKSLFSKD